MRASRGGTSKLFPRVVDQLLCVIPPFLRLAFDDQDALDVVDTFSAVVAIVFSPVAVVAVLVVVAVIVERESLPDLIEHGSERFFKVVLGGLVVTVWRAHRRR